MSVLESLRKRSGLLVAIVGIALLAFVLMGLLESRTSLFGGSEQSVGQIAGKSIDLNAFSARVQELTENYKANLGKSTLDQEQTDQVVQTAWNMLIDEEVIQEEYRKLGIAISDEEIYDIMIEHPHPAMVQKFVNPQTGAVNPDFADPATGQLSPAKIKGYSQKEMKPQEEEQWAAIEKEIKEIRIREKYNNLIKKGLYITSSAAKHDFALQNTSANVRFVGKNFKQIADSTVKFTDSDLNNYYNTHSKEFKQETSRKIEYVAFDIAPSEEDREEAMKNMQAVAEKFKSNTADEDSTFVIAESDSRRFDDSYHAKGTLSPEIDTIMFNSPIGAVVGPYKENETLKVSKLISTKTAADSAKVRHILISYKGSGASETVSRTQEQAKKLADSLLTVIKKSNGIFPIFVEIYSDDNGKRMPPDKKPGEYYTGKGGDYGWLNANSAFVEPFKNAGLDNKKGTLLVVESQFGYHIMEVLDTKGAQKKVQVATIDRRLEPSNKTMQNTFVQASEFSGKNNTNELFQKAVIDNKLNKRVVEAIKESDKTIPGLESPRPLIRWVYENEKGSVSEPMELGSKFVVAVVADIKEKGVAPFEFVKEEITAKVIKEKKAELIAAEFSGAGSQIEAIASKMGLSIDQAQNINFNSNSLGSAGGQPNVIGGVSALKEKSLSKPLTGRDGVFVVYVESVTAAPEQKDYKAQQSAATAQLQPRVENDVYEALKENAHIEEHLYRLGL